MKTINKMYLEAEGKLKYQMNIKDGSAKEKIMIFENQNDLIKKLEEIEEIFKNEERFYNWLKKNVKISCFCKINILKEENLK